MTEMLENIERRMQARAEKRAAQPRYIIDPVAFFVALIGGPLMVTLATCWILFIPVIALGLGGPVYLILGTPLLLIHLHRNAGDTGEITFLAFLANLSLFPLAVVADVLGDPWDLSEGILFYGAFGMIFAPAWAAGFGYVYTRLRRDFYTHPQFI